MVSDDDDEGQDDYEEDFESMSKSQIGLSIGKNAAARIITAESYSNE
jgi:hypothetical protein